MALIPNWLAFQGCTTRTLANLYPSTPVFRKGFEWNLTKASNKASSCHFLEEDTAISTFHYSLAFDRIHYWNNIFIEKIDQLITTGWIQKFESDQNSNTHRLKQNEEPEP
jgi:hypothetical protein